MRQTAKKRLISPADLQNGKKHKTNPSKRYHMIRGRLHISSAWLLLFIKITDSFSPNRAQTGGTMISSILIQHCSLPWFNQVMLSSTHRLSVLVFRQGGVNESTMASGNISATCLRGGMMTEAFNDSSQSDLVLFVRNLLKIVLTRTKVYRWRRDESGCIVFFIQKTQPPTPPTIPIRSSPLLIHCTQLPFSSLLTHQPQVKNWSVAKHHFILKY